MSTQTSQAERLLQLLKLGDCWCEMAIGNPMVKDHSEVCKRIQKLFQNRNYSPKPEQPHPPLLTKNVHFVQIHTGHYYRAPGHRSPEEMRAVVRKKFGTAEAERIKDEHVQHAHVQHATGHLGRPETRAWVWWPAGI